MLKIIGTLILSVMVLSAQEEKCFDIGDVSGNHIYEYQDNKTSTVYQCKKSISQCQEILTPKCQKLSDELLKYMRYVEVKSGFLTTQNCLDEGLFHDCPLMEYHDNEAPLLLVDIKGRAHKLDLQSIPASTIDKLILKKNVSVQGHYIGDSETIKVDKIFQSMQIYIP